MRLANSLFAWPAPTSPPPLEKKPTISTAPNQLTRLGWCQAAKRAISKCGSCADNCAKDLQLLRLSDSLSLTKGKVRSTTEHRVEINQKILNTKKAERKQIRQKVNSKTNTNESHSYRASSSRCSSYGCACFAGFSGTDCGHGPLCTDVHTNICQNGGTCK